MNAPIVIPLRLEDDPLFRTHKGALLFALNYTHGGMKAPSITALMGGTRKGRGLGGLDGAAQAGMIQLELKQMSDLRRAVVVARYAVSSVPCACRAPCCREYRENPDWAGAVEWLTRYVLEQALTGNVSHYHFRRMLVARHFGVRETFIDVAARCGVDRHTASRQYKAIHEHLKAEERLARFEIEGILKNVGVVE